MIDFPWKSKTHPPDEKIVDYSTLRPVPERLPLHCLYLLFFSLAVISSLWQHGHPVLTILILIFLPIIGILAYIPYHHLSSAFRFRLQLLVIVIAGIWCVFRLKHQTPIDKVLIESVCIAGLCFAMAQRAADYDYLFLVSIFLLLYGSLLPRAIFILVFFFAFMLAMLLLFSTRIKAFACQPNLKNPRRIVKRSWPFFLAHLIVATAIFWYIFSLLPMDDRNGGSGLFAVSFRTDNDFMLPPAFRNWFFAGKKIKKDATGKLTVKSQTPTSIGKNGARIKLKKGEYMSSFGNGGSSAPSNELIFRVKTPVKLYWVGQLYDEYDGINWITSQQLKRVRITDNSLVSKIMHHRVEQNFSIKKWLSPKLYAAYRPIGFDTFIDDNPSVKIKRNSFQAEITDEKYPSLPFNYNVSSILYMPEFNLSLRSEKIKKHDYWIEKIPRNHYLKLPQGKISNRVQTLAHKLTARVSEPFKQALALRDYLRNNYHYEQFSTPVPTDREAVDFFLFELKSGHCEYFASALTTLARLTGLPARVATGFSPGNYNALTKHFEVHAYHAHAWTQIFIDGMGWLTFDATPPASVPSQTTPFGIGSLRDPFGDSWRVTPPEITHQTLEYIREGFFERLAREQSGQEFSVAEQVLIEAALAPEKAQAKVNNILDYLFPNVKGEGKEKMRNLLAKLKYEWRNVIQRINFGLLQLSSFLRKYWKLPLFLLPVVIAMVMEIKMLRHYWIRKKHLKKCRDLYALASAAMAANKPSETVSLCYLSVRIMLNMAGLNRKKNADLLTYGTSLRRVDQELRKNVTKVFYLFSKQEYGLVASSSREAEYAIRKTTAIRDFIYQTIREK